MIRKNRHAALRSCMIAALAVLIALCFTMPALADTDDDAAMDIAKEGATINAEFDHPYTLAYSDADSNVITFRVTAQHDGELKVDTSGDYYATIQLCSENGDTLVDDYVNQDRMSDSFYGIRAGQTYLIKASDLNMDEDCTLSIDNIARKHTSFIGGTIDASLGETYYVQRSSTKDPGTQTFKIKTDKTGALSIDSSIDGATFVLQDESGEKTYKTFTLQQTTKIGVTAGTVYTLVVKNLGVPEDDAPNFSIAFDNPSYKDATANAKSKSKAKTIKSGHIYHTVIQPNDTKITRWVKIKTKRSRYLSVYSWKEVPGGSIKITAVNRANKKLKKNKFGKYYAPTAGTYYLKITAKNSSADLPGIFSFQVFAGEGDVDYGGGQG